MITFHLLLLSPQHRPIWCIYSQHKWGSLPGCRHQSLPLLKNALHRGSLIQPPVPGPCLRIVGLPFGGEVRAHGVRRMKEDPMPGHEGEIGVGAFVAHQVGLARLLELGVQDAENTMDP